MATVGFTPGRVDVTVSSDAKLSPVPPSITEAPGGLYPLQTKSYEMDEYRMQFGWPVPIPPHDIHCNTLVSGSGVVFAERDPNTAIETNALVRWVADADYYDEEALRWNPLVDNTGFQNVWETSVDYAPVLIHDYEYRVKSEKFVMDALNFDSDTRNHMWADFSTTFGGSTGYTVIMVMSPNSVYGNNDAVRYSGLWCPGGETPVGDTFTEDLGGAGWASVTVQGGYLYYETHGFPKAKGLPITQQLVATAPMYLAFAISPVESTLYVGFGPGKIRSISLPSENTQTPMYSGVVLGRSHGDVLHTADMALLDLGIYASRLGIGKVRQEFAILSRCYGGVD